MGLTNFVGRHILPGRSSRASAQPPPPADAPPPCPPPPTTPAPYDPPEDPPTPRRRRIHHARARDRDRLRPDRRDATLRPASYLRSSPPPHPAPTQPAPWPQKPVVPPPPSRRAWRRARASSRVRSEMHDATLLREPPTSSRLAPPPPAPPPRFNNHSRTTSDFVADPATDSSHSLKRLLAPRRTPQPHPHIRPHHHHVQMQMQGKASLPVPAFPSRDPPRRAHYHRSNGRIRSNLDTFMRRDKEHSQEHRTLPHNHPGARRRHSMLSDSLQEPHGLDNEPISLINEFMHPDPDLLTDTIHHHFHHHDHQSFPLPLTSHRLSVPAISPRTSVEHYSPSSFQWSRTRRSEKTKPLPKKPILALSSSSSSASTASSASTVPSLPSLPAPPDSSARSSSPPSSSAPAPALPSVQHPRKLPQPRPSPTQRLSSRSSPPPEAQSKHSRQFKSPPSKPPPPSSSTSSSTPPPQPALSPPLPHPSPPPPPLTPPIHSLIDNIDEEEPRSMRKRYEDAETAGLHLRFFTDASFPARQRHTISPAFVRSQSNPSPAKETSTLPKRTQRRPPPLRTPGDDANGFAFGVGAASTGIRQIAIVGNRLGNTDTRKNLGSRTTVKSAIEAKSSSSPALGSAQSNRLGSPGELDEVVEPKMDSRFDFWGTDTTKEGGSSGNSFSRFLRKPTDKEQDLFLFEEASQSSFGDTETPSRRAAKNGIVPIERRRELAEVTEDHFVFGADGSFNDGGFIISSHGLVEAPEKVMRKKSDGLVVDGVPTSSNNLIFVKSLNEFRKSFVFKAKSKDESSTLGRGAAGRVYLANHEPTGRKIAVKEINVYDDDKRDQLKKELQTLISHESRFLVRSFGAFYDGAGVVHVTLEYMDRGALSDVVKERGRMPEPVMCKIAEHCLRGLSFLHENHILHRDVKTGNILLSRKLCRAKLSDFGLARDLAEGSSVTDTFVGTLAYMSPERLHGSEYTYASDIWGLGISLLECAMGKYPFAKPQSYFDIVDAAQSNPSTLIENEVSSELVDFIRSCTFIDPKERLKATELLDHSWIKSQRDNANALREWLDTIPKLHYENAEVSSEFAFHKKEEAKAKLRAKAQETCL